MGEGLESCYSMVEVPMAKFKRKKTNTHIHRIPPYTELSAFHNRSNTPLTKWVLFCFIERGLGYTFLRITGSCDSSAKPAKFWAKSSRFANFANPVTSP